MRIVEVPCFTWYIPDSYKPTLSELEWDWYGGKWVVHGSLEKSRQTAMKLESYINHGPIVSAKIWHGDPTAILVYSLDKYKKEVNEVLSEIGAADTRVWVYDSLMPNLVNPYQFTRAIFLMGRTISKGRGRYRN